MKIEYYYSFSSQAIDANVLRDIRVKIVKRKKLVARLIHVQHVQCAKMNQDMEITLVCVVPDTPEMTVISQLIHAQLMVAHVQTVLIVLH